MTNLAILAIGLTLMQPAAAETSCNQSIGPAKAHRLVEQCLMVSPATHPPCNADNSCELIISHNIDRCGFLGDGNEVPKFCTGLPKPK